MSTNFSIIEIICYFGQNGIYPSKHDKDREVYDDSELWGKSDTELRQICKYGSEIQIIHRPSNLSVKVQISKFAKYLIGNCERNAKLIFHLCSYHLQACANM